MAPVQVQHLVADYGLKTVIRNLSFTIPYPSFTAIIGHNGSGKSTLLKVLTGQLPFKGEVCIEGESVLPHHNPARNGLLSFLAQKNHVNFSISVRELVVMGNFRRKHFFEHYNQQDYQEARLAMEKLQIEYLAEADYQSLSGGEQQMVWLAQLMVQNARVFLLDEPTQQLDVYNRKKVFDLMDMWVRTQQKTVLCVTHDLQKLFDMKGFLLNLSLPNPSLEEISAHSVQRHLHLLEHKVNIIK